eukprot:6205477-Pleurochrysis_carterae.AAC.2
MAATPCAVQLAVEAARGLTGVAAAVAGCGAIEWQCPSQAAPSSSAERPVSASHSPAHSPAASLEARIAIEVRRQRASTRSEVLLPATTASQAARPAASATLPSPLAARAWAASWRAAPRPEEVQMLSAGGSVAAMLQALVLSLIAIAVADHEAVLAAPHKCLPSVQSPTMLARSPSRPKQHQSPFQCHHAVSCFLLRCDLNYRLSTEQQAKMVKNCSSVWESRNEPCKAKKHTHSEPKEDA